MAETPPHPHRSRVREPSFPAHTRQSTAELRDAEGRATPTRCVTGTPPPTRRAASHSRAHTWHMPPCGMLIYTLLSQACQGRKLRPRDVTPPAPGLTPVGKSALTPEPRAIPCPQTKGAIHPRTHSTQCNRCPGASPKKSPSAPEAGSWLPPLPGLWPSRKDACLRGRVRQPGTDHAVLTELQTRGPDCRRGFLESPEEWLALSWGDRVANGAAASFTVARLQRATWCLLGPGRGCVQLSWLLEP